MVTSGEKTKFGVSEDLFDELRAVADKYQLNIVGLHQHLGSLFLDDKIDDYLAGVAKMLELAHTFKGLRIIDLGGGFGVNYLPDGAPLNFELLNTKLVPMLKDFLASYGNVHFIFEPGRIAVAEAGVLLGKVTAIKENMGNHYVGTDIGMGIIERPSRYESYHHIEVLNQAADMLCATIVGNVCESCDVLGEKRDVRMPNINDPAILYDAGAYGFSMASNYTSRPRTAEVLLHQGKSKLIRKAENTSDLLSKIPPFS